MRIYYIILYIFNNFLLYKKKISKNNHTAIFFALQIRYTRVDSLPPAAEHSPAAAGVVLLLAAVV